MFWLCVRRQRPLEYESNSTRTLAMSMDLLKTEYLPEISRVVTTVLSSNGKGWWNDVPTEIDIFQLTKAFHVMKRVQFALEYALQQAFWSSVSQLLKQVWFRRLLREGETDYPCVDCGAQITNFSGIVMTGQFPNELRADFSGTCIQPATDFSQISRFLSSPPKRAPTSIQPPKPLFSISVQYVVHPAPSSPSPRTKAAPVETSPRKGTVGDASIDSSVAEIDIPLVGDIGGDSDSSSSDSEGGRRDFDDVLSSAAAVGVEVADELMFDVPPGAVGQSVIASIHSLVKRLSSIQQVCEELTSCGAFLPMSCVGV